MALTQYNGFGVLEVEPSFDDPQSKYVRSNFRLDSKTGAIRTLDRTGVAVVEPHGFRWVMDGRVEVQAYRDFLSGQLGACVPFWVPSWRNDLVLSQDVPANSASFLIKRSSYTKFQFSAKSRRYIAVIMPDRTKYYRKITTAVDGTNTESITLDSGVPVIMPQATVISFLSLVRLSFDDPQLMWHNSNLAEVTLDFTELPLEVPAP